MVIDDSKGNHALYHGYHRWHEFMERKPKPPRVSNLGFGDFSLLWVRWNYLEVVLKWGTWYPNGKMVLSCYFGGFRIYEFWFYGFLLF